jgi:hypothetical protein
LDRKHSPAAITAESDAYNPDTVAIQILEIGTPRKVHLLGFLEKGCTKGVQCAGEALIRSIERLGCKGLRRLEDADFVFFNVGKRNPEEVQKALTPYGARQVVLLFKDEQSRMDFNTNSLDYDIICLHRPLLPSTLRMLLFQAKETHQKAGVKPPSDFKAAEESVETVTAVDIVKSEQQTALPAVTMTTGLRKESTPANASKPKKMLVMVVEDNRIVSEHLPEQSRYIRLRYLALQNRKILVQYLKKMVRDCGTQGSGKSSILKTHFENRTSRV